MRGKIAVIAVGFMAFAPTVLAACREAEGSILFPYPDQADTGIFALVESVAPGAIPNGVFYYTICCVQGGDAFTIRAQNQELLMVGTADECPGPANTRGRIVDALVAGDPNEAARLLLEEFWVLCHYHPDFDVKFTGGEYGNGPGDEAGTVPGDGAVVVTMFFGKPGSKFTYTQCD